MAGGMAEGECMYCASRGSEAWLKDHELWCQCKAGFATVAQSAERVLGKDEVGSSILPGSSKI